LAKKFPTFWSEESPAIYSMAEYIQNEFLFDYFAQHPVEESKGIDDELQGKVILAYKSSKKCEEVFKKVQEAYRREYNNEGHNCAICYKHYLGEHFFFLSGCEHQYCSDCLRSLVESKLS